jgi:recombination protein RecA
MAKKKEEKETFSDVLKRLNKTYGEGAIMSLNDKSKSGYDVISTGSIGFDYNVLGVGGFVKGKLYELIGWEGTGKSTLCGHLAAECQKDGGKVVYIDGEHAVDKNYFKALGVNIDDMLFSQPSCGEEGFQIALETIATGEVDLVILDSDSSLFPKKVIDGDVGESAIGRKALLNSNAYPKIKNKLVENNTCVVVISQWREKIGVMFGDSRTTQGGHALKFYSDCRIDISKSLSKDGTEIIGNLTKIKTIKNKTNPPFKKCEFDIAFGVGIDKPKELMDLANDLEIGRKYGKTYTFNDIKYNLEEFLEKLNTDEKFYTDLRKVVIKKLSE